LDFVSATATAELSSPTHLAQAAANMQMLNCEKGGFRIADG